LSVEAMVRRLRDNEAKRRMQAADDALLIAALEAVKAYRADGHASVYGMLRSMLGWSERECRQRVRLARLVADHPAAGEALFEARAGVANIAEIGAAHANPRCRDELEPVLGELLTEADRQEHHDFRLAVRRWVLLSDPVSRRHHAEAQARRTARFTIGSASGSLHCEWGTLDAACNQEIFERFYNAEFEADWAKTVELHGEQACTALMPRTAQQRAADTITAIFQRAAAVPAGAKTPAPLVNIHLDWHTYQSWMIEQGFFPEQHVDPFEDPTPLVTRLRCQSGDGVLVDPDTVMRHVLYGHIRFVALDETGIPIKWGRRRRLFEGAARQAVIALSPRCTHTGCRVRAGRSQADHLVRWADGGDTSPDNGGPRCNTHNRFRNQGFTTHRDRQGNWHTHRPDGTEI
jgi:hypothetical protein